MKRAMLAALAVVIVFSVFSSSMAREPKTQKPIFYRPDYEETSIDIPGYEAMMSLAPVAAVDTYCVVWYDFEQMNWQGWTIQDNTAQVDTFFHVDDFDGLDGGRFGRLEALEGTKSLWCGTRPGSDYYLCSWYNAPGYGNKWNQSCQSDPIPFEGILTWSYKCVFDSEPDWDITYVEYDSGDENWVEIASYDGVESLVASHELVIPRAATKLRFHFISDIVWSDQDGLYDTDGAFIVDSITVQDVAGIIDYEDFEGYGVGAKADLGIWRCLHEDPFGSCAGLVNNLVSEDPCGQNFGSVIVFFNCPGPYPDWDGYEFNTPFCTGPGGISNPCQDEMAISPVIDMAMYSTNCDEVQDASIPGGGSALGGVLLRYAVYVDLPLQNLVFRFFKVRNIVDGCPSVWKTPDIYVPYEPSKIWYQDQEDISSLVTSPDDPLQVALGVVDMCGTWYGLHGDCAVHTQSPWYDNVRIIRYETTGPQWSVRRGELFQDTFPQEVSGSMDPMEEFCRADMAADIAPGEVSYIDPGDSAVVRVSAPYSGGLDTLETGEARVYYHANVSYIGGDPQKPDLYGIQLEGDYGRYVSDDGDWTILLCEPARTWTGVVAPNAYCVDLNDSLFTRGYMIEYYFKAYDLDGVSSTYPANAESMPPPIFFGTSNLLEFTCLPTLRVVPSMLYVDDFDGRGTFNGVAQLYYDWTFRHITWVDEDIPDRYDVNGPSSALSNGIGAYTSVTDASSIFCLAYVDVIFDSGDLSSCTISEGTDNSDKSNDAQLLVDWMNVSEHKVGLLVMGDQIAYDLSTSMTAVALELVSTICGVTLANNSYLEMTGGVNGGGIVSPIITGVTGGPFDGLSYFAFGGCPYVNEFDVLEKTGPGQYALAYPQYNDLSYYAGIYTDQLNAAVQSLRTVWVGHSFQYIRNATLGALARNMFFFDLMSLFQHGLWLYPGADTETPKVTSLSQNFPNPFNPSTRLKYGLKEKGHVSIRVYDVSGRLVRVLVNEVREVGSYEAVWDGTNDEGRPTASGIYFCRMEAGEYEKTLKMVMMR